MGASEIVTNLHTVIAQETTHDSYLHIGLRKLTRVDYADGSLKPVVKNFPL